MGASATLIKFAKSREAAYLQYGRLTGARARAISRIRQLADFHSRQSDAVQLLAVRQVESELLEILPHAESRYKSQRREILSLIDQSKQAYEHKQSRLSAAAAGRGTQTSKGSQGTQLSFI